MAVRAGENLTFEDPDFDPNNTIGSLCFCSAVINISTQRVKRYSTFLEPGNHTILYAAKRDWAQKNAAQVKLFREAVQEAAAFIGQPKNDSAVRAAIAKYTKLPPEIVAKVQISPPGPGVSEKQLAYWVGLMKDQGMLQTDPKVANLIVK